MAIRAFTLTSGWQSALARFRQLAATARAPSNLQRKTIALDMTERVIVAAIFGQFAFRTQRSYEQSADIVTLLLLLSETLPFFLILLRKPSTTLSDRPSDWFFSLAGTIAVLVITPVPTANQIRAYWWCSPPRIGRQRMRPTVSAARDIGASLCNDKWVPL
jgi:hypothetical protein